MRVVFLGTPKFAVLPLESLIKSKHDVILVISQPDREKDRKGNLLYTPVKATAIKHGVEVLTLEKIDDKVIEKIKGLKPDILITCAFGQILKDDFLCIAPCLNIHASILPKFRGSSPIQAAIIKGESETGVTIMQTELELDAGDILLIKKIAIGASDTSGTLSEKLSETGAIAIVQALDKIEKDKKIIAYKQDSHRATFTKKIKKQDGEIDWGEAAEEIERKIRAFNPWPGAYSTTDGEVIKIHSAVVKKLPESANPLVIKCGKDYLEILTLQAAGKKILSGKEFLLGKKFNGFS